jgi:LysM repeat protein
MYRKSSAFLVSLVVLGTLAVSACTQTYSQAPLATPTLISTGIFVSPFPSGQDPLKIVADLGTQTAMAKTAQAGGTVNPASTAGLAGGTPLPGEATALSGPVTALPATVEPLATSQAPLATVEPGSSGGRPASYTVQQGEFPYCIARRFNVNPDDLLAANGLTGSSAVYPGKTLTIPQAGSFPGDRSLLNHPDTYTVDSANTTIYAIACEYGDVLPQDIASANGISLSSALTVGQQLSIP